MGEASPPFLLVCEGARAPRLRFRRLASGAYFLEVLLPGVNLPPHVLGSAEGEALADFLESTGLWRREDLEVPHE